MAKDKKDKLPFIKKIPFLSKIRRARDEAPDPGSKQPANLSSSLSTNPIIEDASASPSQEFLRVSGSENASKRASRSITAVTNSNDSEPYVTERSESYPPENPDDDELRPENDNLLVNKDDDDVNEEDASNSELTQALAAFKKNYVMFAKKNQQLVLVDEYVQEVFTEAEGDLNIQRAAKIFSSKISDAMGVISGSRKAAEGKWTTKLGDFLAKLYPVARLSLNVASAVADVLSKTNQTYVQGVSFSPLKGVAVGLGIILQIIAQSNQGKKFLLTLRRIEFQAAILSDNSYDLNSESTRDFVQEKSKDLLKAIIEFFSAALAYFNNNLMGSSGEDIKLTPIGRITKTVMEGSMGYDEALTNLEVAIREYDQSVLHLAASVITGFLKFERVLTEDMKYKQEWDDKERMEKEFLKWLSPSSWLVEAQLHSIRELRDKNSLKWARDLEEFRNWRLASHESTDRMLWIRGSLGIGKSTMASYFIDLLKRHYPESIVAYFFCRTNQKELRKARDIVRTLSYQCSGQHPKARKILEALRKEQFPIEDKLGLSFLFNKLLLGPVCTIENDIFIILDGLDEADLTTIDEASDRSNWSEMQVLLKCLTALPSTRLLFISRPDPILSKILPRDITTKTIGKDQNQQDIDAYVKQFIDGSSRLKSLFTNEKIDPFKYFETYANGIFLWVALVLPQLEDSKYKSIFQKQLKTFSDASGSMERLYRVLLSRIGQHDRKCVREIIRWLIVAEEQLSVSDLKESVEYAIKDELPDFRRFLEIDCGSILHFLPDEFNPGVQLIHETFRSFVLCSDECPPEFHIDEETSHGHVALYCLKSAVSASRYGLSNWSAHLSKATSSKQAQELLGALSQFVMSNGLEVWIKDVLLMNMLLPEDATLSIEMDQRFIEPVMHWLKNCAKGEFSEGSIMGQNEAFGSPNEQLQWQVAALRDGSVFTDSFGRATGRLWLSDELELHYVRICFLLALKYYCCMRRNVGLTNCNTLTDLKATNFLGLSIWATGQDQGPAPQPRSIAQAFYVLRWWDNYIDTATLLNESISAEIFMNNSNYDRVIEMLRNPSESQGTLLFRAYDAKGDYNGAIEAFSELAQGDNYVFRYYLGHAFARKGDHEAAFKEFNELGSNFNWKLFGIYATYMMKGDYDGGIEWLEGIEEINLSGNTWPLICLRDLYSAKGDYNGVIMSLSKGLEWPNHSWIMPALFQAYVAVQDYQGAMNEFENVFVNGKSTFSGIYPWEAGAALEAYIVSESYDRAITAFETYQNRNGNSESCAWALIEAYKGKGDYDGAMEVFNFAVDGPNVRDEILDLLVYAILGIYNKVRNREGLHLFVENRLKWSTRRNMLSYYGVLELAKANQDHNWAVEIFYGAICLDPMSSWNWRMLAEIYKATGDYAAARDTYQSAINQIQDDYTLYKGLGDVLILTANYLESITAYDTVLKKAGRKSVLWAYLQMQPYQITALYRSRIAIPVDETLASSFLWHSLAKACEAADSINRAAEIYDIVINAYISSLQSKSSNNLLWQYSGLEGQARRQDIFHAKTHLPDVVVWSVLGSAYECNENLGKALGAFERALELEANNTWLKKKIAELRATVPTQITKIVGADGRENEGEVLNPRGALTGICFYDHWGNYGDGKFLGKIWNVASWPVIFPFI